MPIITIASITTKKPSGRKNDKSSPSPKERMVSPINFAAHRRLFIPYPLWLIICKEEIKV